MNYLFWCGIGDSDVFKVSTTLITILIGIVTCISAIYIANKQRKIGENAYLNGLSVELVTDFISPFEACCYNVRTIYECVENIESERDKKISIVKTLGKYSVNTQYLYWEQHKGDIENALNNSRFNKKKVNSI